MPIALTGKGYQLVPIQVEALRCENSQRRDGAHTLTSSLNLYYKIISPQ